MSIQRYILALLISAIYVSAKVLHRTSCSSELMSLELSGEDVVEVSLGQWKGVPGCQARLQGKTWLFSLALDDSLECGITRVRNRLTGETVFYHHLTVTLTKGEEILLVKCRQPSAEVNGTLSNLVKRNVLPAEFAEPDFIEITSEVTGSAPVPILNVGVRQNGAPVEGELTVVPGTPLTMEVFLDSASAGTYGILMNFMEVTDTGDKKETIVFNGCSMDPYLFDNFITTDGDSVSAKFRAFKFPETNYVLFRGTVDVCIDKCQGISCSNGQVGFGRRRRSAPKRGVDPNKIFEVTMTTFLKVNENAIDKGSIGKIEVIAEESVGVAEYVPVGVASPVKGSLPWTRSPERTVLRRAPDEEPSSAFFSDSCRMSSLSWLLFLGSFLLIL